MRRLVAIAALLLASACRGGHDAPSAPLSSDAPAQDGPAPTETPSALSSAEAEPPPPTTWGTIVDLHGNATPPPAIPEGAPRVASVAMLTEIRKAPSNAAAKIGYLRAGAVVEAEAGEHGKTGCPGGWKKIKPYGFVCLGPEATTDMNNPIVRASTRRPDVTQKLPYMYGIAVRGGPAYARIPTDDDLKEFEPHLKTHLAKWAKDKESGATFGLDVWLKWATKPAPPALEAMHDKVTDEDIPWFLKDGGRVPNLSNKAKSSSAVKIDEVARKNGVAFVESFLWQGRRYNVSTDLRVMAADRFRPIHGSEFHGYVIGEDVQVDGVSQGPLEFPFALVRKKGSKKLRFDGKKMVDAGELVWRAAINLTGKQKLEGSKLFYETKDGFWIDDRSAGRVDPAKKMPGWGKNGEKWIDVNVTKQVLVAYEGTKPVYATLVSTGEAGLGDPEKTKSTKRGIFRIHTKYLSITMDSDIIGEEFELRDVPYVQYFEDGYALHGSYWHDMFGTPKSHGCVNLAPEDARRLFFWSEPQIPPGWQGVSRALTGTVVFVHP